MPPIYLDNAASTRVAPEVVALMTEVMQTAYGNPSSAHPQGAAARGHIATARTRVLAAIGDAGGARGDVVWTSGCSEADALAVLGAARAQPGPIVTTAIEHPAVTATAARVGRVIEVPCGADGVVDPEAIARAVVDGEAHTLAIVMVQNEIGVVQPVAAAIAAVRAAVAGKWVVHIHVDAAQALGKVPIDVTAMGCDSIAFAGHKLHGPKGVGALWLARGAKLEPLWVGGGQQGGLRGGTQDAPGAAGFGLAAERAVSQLAGARAKWLGFAATVGDMVGGAMKQLVPDQRRAPHILALGLPATPADAIRNVLASRGVYISTGSACASGASGGHGSKILEAIGLPESTGMVRFSFAHDTTEAEVAVATETLVDAARSLRA